MAGGEEMRGIPILTRIMLLLNGWWPKRRDPKSLPKSFEPFPIAMETLRKYGGRSLRKPSEVLVLDPTAGDEIAGDIKKYEILPGRRLYPLGVREHQEKEHILIDENGVIYVLMDGLIPIAPSFERFIHNYFWNKQSRAIVGNELRSVGLEGVAWKLQDDESFHIPRPFGGAEGGG